jgi:hypothetical protein
MSGLMQRSKERARLHAHSIISSARADSVGGTSMPSAFAVLRLITILAARADKQIHIAMLGIMLTRDEPAQGLARELNSRVAGSHGPQYGITRGVVERDTQMQRLSRRGTPFRGGDLTCKPIGQSVAF